VATFGDEARRVSQDQRPLQVRHVQAGEPFVIAKAGKPMVRVTAPDAPTGPQMRRLGFLSGEIAVPEDFDRMGGEVVGDLFGGS
jgi:antitoxin (DNA-binding transcriptional repressor) of toxin-antitoxin stability system